jgi:DNA repair protein RadA/Sms
VPSGQERIREAAKHGFTRAIVPLANVPKDSQDSSLKQIQIIGVKTLSDALDAL